MKYVHMALILPLYDIIFQYPDGDVKMYFYLHWLSTSEQAEEASTIVAAASTKIEEECFGYSIKANNKKHNKN